MDEWAALDREAAEWDAMERGGADIEVWVQYLFVSSVVYPVFRIRIHTGVRPRIFFWQKVERILQRKKIWIKAPQTASYTLMQ